MNIIYDSKVGYPETLYRYVTNNLSCVFIDRKMRPIDQSEYEWFSEMLLNKKFDLTVIEYLMIEKRFVNRETINEISDDLGISYSKCRYDFSKIIWKLQREIGRHQRG